jgi:glycosyltransferase involved in cell wall biosynthesis
MGALVQEAASPLIARTFPLANAANRHPADAATIIGLQSSTLGVGVSAELVRAELEHDRIKVNVLDVTQQIGAAQEASAKPPADQPGAPLIVALNPDIAVRAIHRLGPNLLRNRRVIGYWVWELDRLPSSWRVGAGWVNEIWTMSRYSAAAMREFGVPVHVTPCAAALRPMTPLDPTVRERVRTAYLVRPDDFLAVSSFSLSSSIARKNPIGAIQAFQRAFGGRQDAHLILRCLGGHTRPRALARVKEAAAQADGMVTVIDQPGPLDELRGLYAAADAYISLHRAEGFGLNLAEAMLSELPVVATAYSANMEFMDEHCAALVPFALVAVKDEDGIYAARGASWAEPDLDAAVEQLRRLAANADLRRTIGVAGRRAVQMRLAGGACAEALRLRAAAV